MDYFREILVSEVDKILSESKGISRKGTASLKQAITSLCLFQGKKGEVMKPHQKYFQKDVMIVHEAFSNSSSSRCTLVATGT